MSKKAIFKVNFFKILKLILSFNESQYFQFDWKWFSKFYENCSSQFHIRNFYNILWHLKISFPWKLIFPMIAIRDQTNFSSFFFFFPAKWFFQFLWKKKIFTVILIICFSEQHYIWSFPFFQKRFCRFHEDLVYHSVWNFIYGVVVKSWFLPSVRKLGVSR